MTEIPGHTIIDILNVQLSVNNETKKQNFIWKYGDAKPNIYTLLGLIETIKHDLLNRLQNTQQQNG